ncbi:MAG TPA: XdhC family protein [Longimicrobiales bacterium]|nr:XdhC family protein [Longimicrobiales bacterium]
MQRPRARYMLGAMRSTTQILRQILSWREEGHQVALATVVNTWGSAPRPVGGHMAVCGTGAFVGSVSGGCVEAAVVDVAQGVIADAAPRVVEYGVSDEEAWAVGLACGGRVRIFVAPVGPTGLQDAVIAELIGAREAGEPVVLASWLQSGAHELLRPADAGPGSASDPELDEAAKTAVLTDNATLIARDGSEIFLRPHNPPARLIIVGAAHVTQSLVPLAREAGLDVVVVDPRAAFASVERFPDVLLVRSWPEEALAELGVDHRTAVVTVTHDPKIDDPALLAALRATPFYVGALGSRRTHASRLTRLEAEGLDRVALGKIHAPVGLDIGARTTQEIAVSIVAEVIQALRKGDA